MKKIVSRIFVVLMAVVSLSTLVACGNREACYAKLPTTLPEGVESVTCSSSYTENNISKPGTAYEGKYSITITLKPGYSIGSLVLTADEEDATEHKYYKDKSSTENSVSYNFEDIKKTVKFGLSGKTALIDYTIGITISESIANSENVFNSVNFEFETISKGESTSSGTKTGAELVAENGTEISFTMNYGDTLNVYAWNETAKTAVYTGLLNSSELTIAESYNVDANGIIKTRSTIEVTGNASLTIYKENFTTYCTSVSSSIYFDEAPNAISPKILVGTELFEEGSPEIADFALIDTYNLAVDVSKTNIATHILTNYEDDALSFYVNGKLIEKSSIAVSGGQFVILNQKRPYEFVDSDGNTNYSPGVYNIEVKGVSAFIEENTGDFLSLELAVDDTFGESLGVALQTITIQDKYYQSSAEIQIAMRESREFDIEATSQTGGVITIQDAQTLESGTPEPGVTVTKNQEGDFVLWSISFDSSLKITQIKIK